MKTKDRYFKKYSNISIIKGYNRSVIYDFMRNNYFYIPNTMTDFLEEYEAKKIKKAERIFYKEYIDFLLENEIIFFCDRDELELFPEMPTDWDYYSLISNAILEADNKLRKDFFKGIFLLNEIGCGDFLIYSEDTFSVETLTKILEFTKGKTINSLDFYCSFNEVEVEVYTSILKKYAAVRSIVLFNSDENKILKKDIQGMGNLVKTTKPLDFYNYDKELSLFNLGIHHYTEALHYNTYFNRKAHINRKGEIKNAPHTQSVYGNIQSIHSLGQLQRVFESEAFQELWFSKKSVCEICKVCEYRYICTDSRVPAKRKDNTWYCKEECNYNPYISKWRGEQGYKSLSSCGNITAENRFMVNPLLVENINRELWRD